MVRPLADAFEILVQVEQLGPRLEAAATALAQLADTAEEQAWIAAARRRLEGLSVKPDLLARALRLPELVAMKAERGKLLQIAVADEVERLQAAVTFAGGAQSPLLDTLFLDFKVPALRKCSRAELEKFCIEIERRLMSGYAQRLLANDRYKSVQPTVLTLRQAIGVWADVFVAPAMHDAEADVLRIELLEATKVIENPVRQARLLAQAALLPYQELFDAAGVLTPAGKKKAVSDSHPILEKDPPDPLLPTTAERAEIASLHAARASA
ncbi:hypothetical protein BH11MYX2_BH11MYX2_00290 [soil metagenome]